MFPQRESPSPQNMLFLLSIQRPDAFRAPDTSSSMEFYSDASNMKCFRGYKLRPLLRRKKIKISYVEKPLIHTYVHAHVHACMWNPEIQVSVLLSLSSDGGYFPLGCFWNHKPATPEKSPFCSQTLSLTSHAFLLDNISYFITLQNSNLKLETHNCFCITLIQINETTQSTFQFLLIWSKSLLFFPNYAYLHFSPICWGKMLQKSNIYFIKITIYNVNVYIFIIMFKIQHKNQEKLYVKYSDLPIV